MPHYAANFCFNSYERVYVMPRFPKDSILREKWRITVGREESWKATTNHRLCEEYFKLEDWITFRKRLKEDVVSSLFCNCRPSKSTKSVSKTSICQPLTSLNQNYKIDHSYCRVLICSVKSSDLQHIHRNVT